MISFDAAVIALVPKWSIVLCLALGMADPQILMPCPIPYQAMAPAIPVAVPVPYGVPIPETTTKPTTIALCKREKIEKEQNISDSDQTVKIIIPWLSFPWNSQVKTTVFPFKNNNFTVRYPPQNAMPAPGFAVAYPVPAPQPIIMVPIPPLIRVPNDREHHNHKRDKDERDSSRSKRNSATSSGSSSSDYDSSNSDSDSSNDYSKHKNKKKRKHSIARNSRKFMDVDSSIGIKPMLNFISKNGDIKIQKRLSMNDASALLNSARDSVKKVRIVTKNEHPKERRFMFMAHAALKKEKQDLFMEKTTVLVLNPEKNKKLTNLTLTLNLAK